MRVLTGLAALLVFAALVAPKEFAQLTPAAFVRIPVEALLGVALLLVLPPRARQVAAALGGLALGLLTVLKILDMGFVEVLARPFDPVLDWVLFDDALSFLTDAVGSAGAIGSLITAVVLVIAVPVLLTLAVLRLTPVLVRHRATTDPRRRGARRGLARLRRARRPDRRAGAGRRQECGLHRLREGDAGAREHRRTSGCSPSSPPWTRSVTRRARTC